MNKELENAVDYMPPFIYGRVLEGGLGKGDLSRMLLSYPVDKLVTVEVNEDIVDEYKQEDDRQVLILGDFFTYLEDHGDEFDFIVQDLPNGLERWIKVDGWEITKIHG